MTLSVVSKDYLDMQKKISHIQDQWKEKAMSVRIEPDYNQLPYRNDLPLIVQTSILIDELQYISFISELIELLKKYKPDLHLQLIKITEYLDGDLAKLWIENALATNEPFFIKFAEDHQIDEWIPFFLAEQAIRPYLMVLATNYQEIYLNKNVQLFGCPSCGEPTRVGKLEEDSQKFLYCPRCHAKWHEKKMRCSHCGNEDHQKLSYIFVEEHSFEQLHVCKECHSYVKLIDVRENIVQDNPTLLDLRTLHLDYIAQEQGYGNKNSDNH